MLNPFALPFLGPWLAFFVFELFYKLHEFHAFLIVETELAIAIEAALAPFHVTLFGRPAHELWHVTELLSSVLEIED